jgi:hemerythrin-like domain-containing protein
MSGESEVSPVEDLMREHGLLNRLLLLYEEFIRRLESAAELDSKMVSSTSGLIRTFIEDYHEDLEECHVFPRFLKAGKHVELVTVLRAQHDAGRRLTAEIQTLAEPESFGAPEAKKTLFRDLRRFIRMYRPHEAREDTVLFPALHDLVSAREYDALGEDFEKKEHELFGKEGFEGMVEKTAEIEKAMGLYDLRQFST